MILFIPVNDRINFSCQYLSIPLSFLFILCFRQSEIDLKYAIQVLQDCKSVLKRQKTLRIGLWLRQTEHIHGHLRRKYSVNVNRFSSPLLRNYKLWNIVWIELLGIYSICRCYFCRELSFLTGPYCQFRSVCQGMKKT
jgi:hypothetical protein